MPLSEGTRLGPYEILSPLGAGGMGEVYRAEDTRLGRLVAVKVLPARRSGTVEMRQRFEREARLISSLNHPNICRLYDIGRQEGIDFLVMEYLEGETLANRLKKGALPLDQALRIGMDIADALEKAHGQGIVHRDLKPANIMLTRTGTKLLDFGLAKGDLFARHTGTLLQAAATEGEEASLAEPDATLTMRRQSITATGMILGTLPYMAPEQLEGKEPDTRTDIFAFGAVLYEMATGRRAFEGKSQASLIGAIMERDPVPIRNLQPLAAPMLERMVRKCLAKDGAARWQSAGDLRTVLQWITDEGFPAPEPAGSEALPRRIGRERIAWVAAALSMALVAGLAILSLAKLPEPSGPVQSSINPPANWSYKLDRGPMALSPDGRQLAFVAGGAEGKAMLWVRSLHTSSARPLPGTEGASCPFWSPDSQSLGFFAQGRLLRIEVSGGTLETLAPALDPQGGTWSSEGIILFSPSRYSPILKIAATGGASTPVTELPEGSRQFAHRWPFFLPDGRHFLFTATSAVGIGQEPNDGIYLGSLDSKSRYLLPLYSNAVYAAPGYLLYWCEGSLRAQAFDLRAQKVSGEAVSLAEQVEFQPDLGYGLFSASANGMLVIQTGGSSGLSRLVWYDRSGKELQQLGDPALYYSPRLSHDGRRLAVDRSDTANNGDIWIYDLRRKVSSRLTYDPADESDPVWSPDDTRIVFFSALKGLGDIYQRTLSGAAQDELLAASNARKYPLDWSVDGRYVLFQALDPAAKTDMDLWILSLPDRKVWPWLKTRFYELSGQFSSDVKWIAYASAESGRLEVYIQSFPQPGSKIRVSTVGGSMPAWSRDGKRLFYVSSDHKLMAVSIRRVPAFEAGVPEALFDVRVRGGVVRQYDVSEDGERFLLNEIIGDSGTTPITLIQNWTHRVNR